MLNLKKKRDKKSIFLKYINSYIRQFLLAGFLIIDFWRQIEFQRPQLINHIFHDQRSFIGQMQGHRRGQVGCLVEQIQIPESERQIDRFVNFQIHSLILFFWVMSLF